MKITIKKHKSITEEVEAKVTGQSIVPSWIGANTCNACHWEIEEDYCTMVRTTEGIFTYHIKCFNNLAVSE